MNQTAETVGQQLKAARERKGLSVEKAADDLHFDLSVIEALESGDFARLGPSVYGKGHLKRYAAFLDLPVAAMLQPFDAPPAGPAAPAVTLNMPADTPAGDPSWIPLAGIGAAVFLVVALLMWRPWRPHAVPAPAPATTAEPVDAEARVARVAPDAPPADAEAENAIGLAVGSAAGSAAAPPAVPQAETRAKSDAEPTAGVGRARLRLSFSADSWVDVHDATGARVFAGRGHANSVKTIAGAAPMRVYLGFASGVQLEVNHHAVAIGPQFVAGDVARFEAGADGVLRRDSHAREVSARNPQPRG
jgi:cytoskeleton protein RodZ